MANCKNWKAEAPQAMVCWVCGCNRAQCLANFGLEYTIDGWWDVVLSIGVIYRHIAADRRIPDYGLHGLLCVTICGVSGMRDAAAVVRRCCCAQFVSAHSRFCPHSSEDGNKGEVEQ